MANALHEPELIPARAEDRSFFVTCHHAAYRATVEQMFEWNSKTQDALVSEKFDLPGTHIIRRGSARVGVVGVHLEPTYVLLRDFFVLPDYQNGGVGGLVLKQIQGLASQARLPVRLRTLRVNMRAKGFYERFGFRVVDLDDLHWRMTWGDT